MTVSVKKRRIVNQTRKKARATAPTIRKTSAGKSSPLLFCWAGIGRPPGMRARGSLRVGQAPQDVLEDAAVLVVLHLLGRVDPAHRLEGHRGAVRLLRGDGQFPGR